MKPLPVISLTLEDWEVWHWSEPDWNDLGRLELMDAYEGADDRDFRVMLQALKDRYVDVLVSATEILPRISVSWPLPRRGMKWHQ